MGAKAILLRAITAKIQYLLNPSAAGPIFVIGTGRSGTHWIGNILRAHPAVRMTVETPPMFGWSTAMALNPGLEMVLLPKLIRRYKWQLFLSTPKRYVDKNHPNIWIAEHLSHAFPSALFIGIERNPYSTVASMLKHEGVSAWLQRFREFPIPNRFLGISSSDADGYEDKPVAARAAMRWVAHKTRMDQLKGVLGDRLKVFDYDTLILHTAREVQNLQHFLVLATPILSPPVKRESLEKWRHDLSDEQVTQIAGIVGFSLDKQDENTVTLTGE
jgi:hypothetical protein